MPTLVWFLSTCRTHEPEFQIQSAAFFHLHAFAYKKLTRVQYKSSSFEIRLFITSIEYSAVPSKDCKRPIICLYSITYIFYPTNFYVHKNTNMCTLSELTYVEKPTYVHIFYQYTRLVKMSEHAWLILKEPSTESGELTRKMG